MVNTLSGSVCAYRKETVKPRFIRIDEVMALLDVTQDEAMDVVIESKTPHNMKTIKPFEVKISENHPTEPQTWRVFLDREFTAKLRVIKKDSDTKQTVLVPNAEFKIFNIDKNEYVKQYTTYPSKVEGVGNEVRQRTSKDLANNLNLAMVTIYTFLLFFCCFGCYKGEKPGNKGFSPATGSATG